eukprot:10373410-Karenia_brevis.AAC.1
MSPSPGGCPKLPELMDILKDVKAAVEAKAEPELIAIMSGWTVYYVRWLAGRMAYAISHLRMMVECPDKCAYR